jgi:hypothetical protein
VGEQFFIDSVRNGFKELPPEQQERFRAEVQGFIGQEATHRRLHSLYNGAPRKAGPGERLGAARPRTAEADGRRRTCATGSASPPPTSTSPPSSPTSCCTTPTCWATGPAPGDAVAVAQRRRVRAQEHRLRPVPGAGRHEEWRLKWMRRVTVFFLTDTLRQTVNNLRHDGTLWQWSTWKSGFSYLFGKRGLVRQTYRPWRAILPRRLPSVPAGQQRLGTLAGRAPAPVRAGRPLRPAAAGREAF